MNESGQNLAEPLMIDRKINNLDGLTWSESCAAFVLHRYALDDVEVLSHMARVTASRLAETLQSEEWDYPTILNWIVRFFTTLNRSSPTFFCAMLRKGRWCSLIWFCSWLGGGWHCITNRLRLANLASGNGVWRTEFSGIDGTSFSFKDAWLATMAAYELFNVAIWRPGSWL